MNWSFGIQQQVKNMAIEASYVGSAAYHLIAQKRHQSDSDRRPLQHGVRGPVPARQTAGGQLPAAVYGWGNINPRNAATTPTTIRCRSAPTPLLRRAATRGGVHLLQGAGCGRWRHLRGQPILLAELPQLRPGGLRPSPAVRANYVYALPKVGTKMNFKPAKLVLDNWEVSGIRSFISGAPFNPGLGWTTPPNRPAPPKAPASTSSDLATDTNTFFQWFNTGMAARRPSAHGATPTSRMANFGNMGGGNQCTGPGINNWDLSITKRFPLFREGRFLQFRTEMFNAPNHTQYSGVDTGTTSTPRRECRATRLSDA